jgi:D-beta-D-heptose 7-phosphate kinase/D-beta-D-heptose 1-phosphate adenosyltransferase
MKRLIKITSGFKKAKILVIGDLILDEFIWGTVDRISPEAPVPVVKVSSQSFMPGGACNVANNISSLGGKVFIAGVIGSDLYANILKEQLQQKDISTEGLILHEKRPTSLKTRIIAHNQQVVRIDKENEEEIKGKELNKILKYTKEKINEVDAVLIEDYGKGVITKALLKDILNIAKENKKIITIDPKENHFAIYKEANIITPNRSELEKATGYTIKDFGDLQKAARKLLKELKVKGILVTLGEEGMCLFEDNGKVTQISTVAQQVYDVSGAGDTVIAAVTLALISGATLKEAAHISNCAAGVVVGKVGVNTCTQDELKDKINLEYKKKIIS